MSQQLHPSLDMFYQGVLAYAGLKYEDGVIKNISDKIGDIKIDGNPITLPYESNLSNPNGRHIFHPLNESYSNPETSMFSMYKKRLTLEINLKLSSLIITLLTVVSDVKLQQKAKSSKLVELLSSIGESEMSTVENFVSMIKHAQKEHHESFLVDFHLKKKGQLKGTPYAAIGKVNFIAYNELQRSLQDKDNGYRVFGSKMRKKDIVSIMSVLETLFELVEPLSDEQAYTQGTDHKPFRYFNALLKTSYQVAHRINQVSKMLLELKEPMLSVEENFLDLSWEDTIEEVYNLTDIIRLIPNQTNPMTEAAANKMKAKEPQVSHQAPQVPVPTLSQPSVPQSAPPSYNPQQAHPPQPQQQPQQQPQAPTVEDMIRGFLTQPQMLPMGVMQPMYPPQQQMMPMGMQQPMMYPQQQPQMMPMGMQQQPQYQQPVYQPQPQMMPMGMQQQQPQYQPAPTMMQPQQGPMLMQNGQMVHPQQPPQQSGIPIIPFLN